MAAVTTRRDDAILVITLDRPKANAIDVATSMELYAAFKELDEDPSLRVGIITGTGRFFSAGWDLGAANEGEAVDAVHSPGGFAGLTEYFSLTKPVIAAINGPVAGIGLVMTLYCDIRIAAADAKFTSAFVKRGLIAEYGGAWLASRVMGVANALEIFISGRVFDGVEARDLGLVNKVLPSEGFMDAVMKYARDMAQNNSPRSMRVIKHQIWESLFQGLGEGVELSVVEMKASIASEDFKEGVAHFLEKRQARFSGR